MDQTYTIKLTGKQLQLLTNCTFTNKVYVDRAYTIKLTDNQLCLLAYSIDEILMSKFPIDKDTEKNKSDERSSLIELQKHINNFIKEICISTE